MLGFSPLSSRSLCGQLSGVVTPSDAVVTTRHDTFGSHGEDYGRRFKKHLEDLREKQRVLEAQEFEKTIQINKLREDLELREKLKKKQGRRQFLPTQIAMEARLELYRSQLATIESQLALIARQMLEDDDIHAILLTMH